MSGFIKIESSDQFQGETILPDIKKYEIIYSNIKEEPIEITFEEETKLQEITERTFCKINEQLKIENVEVVHPEVMEEITLKDTFDSDKNVSSAEKTWKCDKCIETFTTHSHLKRHKSTHTKTHQCETCSKKLTSSYKLKLHMFSHTEERPHVCFICGNKFKQSRELDAQMLIHSGERSHECPECGKTFTRI